MRFAFDENVPAMLVNAMVELTKGDSHKIEFAKAYAKPGTDDDYWIANYMASGGQAIVSGDLNIRQKPHELEALYENGVISFFMEPRWSNSNLWIRASMLIYWWPKIVQTAESLEPGDSREVPYRWSWTDMKVLWHPKYGKAAQKTAS